MITSAIREAWWKLLGMPRFFVVYPDAPEGAPERSVCMVYKQAVEYASIFDGEVRAVKWCKTCREPMRWWSNDKAMVCLRNHYLSAAPDKEKARPEPGSCN